MQNVNVNQTVNSIILEFQKNFKKGKLLGNFPFSNIQVSKEN